MNSRSSKLAIAATAMGAYMTTMNATRTSHRKKEQQQLKNKDNVQHCCSHQPPTQRQPAVPKGIMKRIAETTSYTFRGDDTVQTSATSSQTKIIDSQLSTLQSPPPKTKVKVKYSVHIRVQSGSVYSEDADFVPHSTFGHFGGGGGGGNDFVDGGADDASQ
ncbi:unnamed protein product [Ceratitis capitata]|uniref:(Mediterranean fruit fly) hypothetical protein n=1 Tax=Ceratitis capitata TaxID=7213 RepID=A0A811U7J5_CERCA|nr:unnamed protein product [Ceratitis capitata]